MYYTQTFNEDRLKELEKIAPHRERGFKMLSTMKKIRIDDKTLILRRNDK